MLPVLMCMLLVGAGVAAAQEAIPEPDVIYAGRLTSLPARSLVEIVSEDTVLASDTPAGSIAVLRVPLVTSFGTTPAGKATTGMSTRLVVNGVTQRLLTVGERGTIYTWETLAYSSTQPNPIPQLTTSACNNAGCLPAEPCGDGPPCGPGTVCVLGTCRTPTPVPTPTATRTPTGNRSPTRTPTVTPTGSGRPTPTSTPHGSCAGDCDGNGRVGINELVIGVNIALDLRSLDDCPSFDGNDNGLVQIGDLITAVRNALDGCPAE